MKNHPREGTDAVVLSLFQAQHLLQARRSEQKEADTSIDLGISTCLAHLDDDGVHMPPDLFLDWTTVEQIAAAPNSCFAIGKNGVEKIQAFSEPTNRYYSLFPTASAPTMLISGIPMHRIKGTDPRRDTLEKIKAARPVRGQILDTATGLGYTASEAAKSADHVTTIEYDPAALEIARRNPWSRALFDNPNITQRIGDAYDVVPEFDDGAFDGIIHDPPMFGLAGHLYGAEFYAELYRILHGKGRLFHYIGDPESKSGAVTTRGVIRRLQEAGFRRVQRRPRAFGVIAVK